MSILKDIYEGFREASRSSRINRKLESAIKKVAEESFDFNELRFEDPVYDDFKEWFYECDYSESNCREGSNVFKELFYNDFSLKMKLIFLNSYRMCPNWKFEINIKYYIREEIDKYFNEDGEIKEQIKIEIDPNFNNQNNDYEDGPVLGSGTGIIISKDGYLITNHHVVQGAKNFQISRYSNGNEYNIEAELLFSDKANDLALLKFKPFGYLPIDSIFMENSFNLSFETFPVGTKVYAYGYPLSTILGDDIQVTDGMITKKTGIDGDITMYQINAHIAEGSSGGPLFDGFGNLIGITSSGLRKEISSNINFAIKSSFIKPLIDHLSFDIKIQNSNHLKELNLTEQIKRISENVVLIKVKN
jgi:S1-C subfamily serine protease